MAGTQTQTNDDLQSKRDALQSQIDDLAATRSKDAAKKAAEIMKAGEALLSEKDDELAGLREQLAEIDGQFQVKNREAAERAAAARAAEREQRRASFLENVEATLDGVDAMEAAVAMLFRGYRETMAKLGAAREDAKVLSPDGKVRGFDAIEFEARLGARLAALSIKELGGRFRIGGVQFGGGSLYTGKERSWKEQEQQRFASAVAAIVGEGRADG